MDRQRARSRLVGVRIWSREEESKWQVGHVGCETEEFLFERQLPVFLYGDGGRLTRREMWRNSAEDL